MSGPVGRERRKGGRQRQKDGEGRHSSGCLSAFVSFSLLMGAKRSHGGGQDVDLDRAEVETAWMNRLVAFRSIAIKTERGG